MEINITSLIELDQFALSHSKHEGGENAGHNTRNASKERAKETPLLDTEEKLQAMRDFARSSGGWDNEEVTAWSAEEVNALFLQWVAGDCREAPAMLDGVTYEECDRKWFFTHENEPDIETGPFDSRGDAYEQACDELHGPGRMHTADSLDEIDWDQYEVECQKGHCASNLFKGDDGQIYFSLSN